jgi:serine/threonine protein kinase
MPATKLNPRLPLAVENILGKALEKDPDRRYQTAAELRTDLKRLRRDLETARRATPEKATESGSHTSAARLRVGGDDSALREPAAHAAQLVETSTRHSVWAERYDRNLGYVFAIQDEIARSIAQAIQLDANFALAYAGIVHFCGLIYEIREQNVAWIERGLAACDRAMALAPDLPEAMVARSRLF